jgi:hypothetical protein
MQLQLQRQLTAAADYNIWQQQFTSSINSSRDITAAEKQLQQQLTATIRGFVILKMKKIKYFPANIIHRFDSNRVELVHLLLFSYC